MTKKELELSQAVEEGSFDLRKSLGLTFQRTAGQTQEYKSLKGWEQKKLFRKKWAETEYANMMESKTRTTSVSEKWLRKGRYMSFRKIWEMEGLDNSGWTAAKRYMDSCLARGGSFVRNNKMTGRLDFLYVEMGKDEEFSEVFEVKSEQYEQPAKTTGAAPKRARRDEPSSSMDVKKLRTTKQDTPEKPDRADKNKQLNKDVSKAASEAEKTRRRYHEVCSGISGMLKAINEEVEYEWLKQAPGLVTPLSQAFETLQRCFTTPFAKAFVTMGYRDARKDLDNVDLLAHLREIVSGPATTLQEAEKQLAFLRSTHALRRKF